MKIIKSIEGIDIFVDDEDYEFLNQITWTVDKNNYVNVKKTNGVKLEYNFMGIHRLIMNPPKEMQVDHIDGNRLNNQKENLRICTPTQNARNRKVQKQYDNKPKTSKYKGVYWLKKLEKWKVHIRTGNGERIYIGLFTDEICAGNTYNYYAKLYHGEFALLNDIPYLSKDEWEKDLQFNKTSKYRGVSLG